jgi:hypothetical protein
VLPANAPHLLAGWCGAAIRRAALAATAEAAWLADCVPPLLERRRGAAVATAERSQRAAASCRVRRAAGLGWAPWIAAAATPPRLHAACVSQAHLRARVALLCRSRASRAPAPLRRGLCAGQELHQHDILAWDGRKWRETNPAASFEAHAAGAAVSPENMQGRAARSRPVDLDPTLTVAGFLTAL